jgi:hypothetical protein
LDRFVLGLWAVHRGRSVSWLWVTARNLPPIDQLAGNAEASADHRRSSRHGWFSCWHSAAKWLAHHHHRLEGPAALSAEGVRRDRRPALLFDHFGVDPVGTLPALPSPT